MRGETYRTDAMIITDRRTLIFCPTDIVETGGRRKYKYIIDPEGEVFNSERIVKVRDILLPYSTKETDFNDN